MNNYETPAIAELGSVAEFTEGLKEFFGFDGGGQGTPPSTS